MYVGEKTRVSTCRNASILCNLGILYSISTCHWLLLHRIGWARRFSITIWWISQPPHLYNENPYTWKDGLCSEIVPWRVPNIGAGALSHPVYKTDEQLKNLANGPMIRLLSTVLLVTGWYDRRRFLGNIFLLVRNFESSNSSQFDPIVMDVGTWKWGRGNMFDVITPPLSCSFSYLYIGPTCLIYTWMRGQAENKTCTSYISTKWLAYSQVRHGTDCTWHTANLARSLLKTTYPGLLINSLLCNEFSNNSRRTFGRM